MIRQRRITLKLDLRVILYSLPPSGIISNMKKKQPRKPKPCDCMKKLAAIIDDRADECFTSATKNGSPYGEVFTVCAIVLKDLAKEIKKA